MKQLSPGYSSNNLRVFFACLLSFNIFITPIAAIAATIKPKSEVRNQKSESNKAAADDVFAKPLEEKSSSSLPAPRAESAPAPLPAAAPPVGAVTASLTASLLAANGGIDADSDGKADPGDTIAYTLSLANSSGAGATGLAIANPLDSHTTLVPGSLNSTPVAFDQSVSLNEDSTLVITLSGQDPDGTVTPNFTFKQANAAHTVFTNFPSNPTTIATAHGTIGTFGSVSCDANGVCSQQVTYTPAANYNGPDSFTFVANDSTANSNENGVVSITVNPVNDAPTFTVPASNPPTVNEDAGVQSVSSYITGVRPAQSGNSTEDTQTVNFVITNVTHSALFTAGGQPALNVSNGGNQPFPITATLTYTPAPDANGTSVVTYHLHDNGGTANGGVDNSADQTFTITVNAVNDAPVAQPKAFTVQANMKITGLTGLLTGVTDPDATNGAADSLSFDAQAGYTTPSVTLTSVTLGTCTNGTISNVNTNGTFDFDPPPGLSGGSTCVLNYVVTDTKNPGPGVASASQNITITAQGPAIWFVDPNRTNNGNGTLSNAADAAGNPGPFKSLSSANAKLATLATNQKVFIYTGTTASGVSEVLDLVANNDWLVGQGTVATSFDSFFGLTGGNAPPAGTVTRPTLNSNTTTANSARPTVSGTVTMRNNTQVTGVNIVVTGANKGLTSGGFSSGTSLISDVSVTSATGNAVDLSSGTQTLTYVTSDATNSPNVLAAVGGIALNVGGGVTFGAAGFNFKSISANGGTKGISLNSTGNVGSLTVSGTGTTAGSGGTIQSLSGRGIELIGTAGAKPSLTIKNMNLTNTAQTNGDATTTNCGITAASGANANCSAAIHLNNASGVTLDNVNINGSNQNGINGLNVVDLKIQNGSIVQNCGNESQENGVYIQNLSGNNNLLSNSTFQNNNVEQFSFVNWVAGTLGTAANPFNVTGCTFIGKGNATTPGGDGFYGNIRSSGTGYISVGGGANSPSHFRSNYSYGTEVLMNDTASATFIVNGCDFGTLGTTSTYNNSGVAGGISQGSTLNYTFTNNTIYGSAFGTPDNGTPILLTTGTMSSGATLSGSIAGNTIGDAATATSGCKGNCNGITVLMNGSGAVGSTATFVGTISNNNIHRVGAFGIQYIGGDQNKVAGSLHITSNTIDNPDFPAACSGTTACGQGISLSAETSAGSLSPNNSTLCADIGNGGANTVNGAWNAFDIRVQALRTSTFKVAGWNGSPANDPTAFIVSKNTGSDPVVVGKSNGSTNPGTFTGDGTVCSPLLFAIGGVASDLNWLSAGSRTYIDQPSFDYSNNQPANLPAPALGGVSDSLTQSQLDSIVAAAIDHWRATGLTQQQISALQAIEFGVGDLADAYLGDAGGNRVQIDRKAGGKGWFVDPTPQDDSEFGNVSSATRRYTDPSSAPAGHVDLLTAIMHEMGHKLGLGDSYLERDRNDLMYGYLTVGERRLPAKDQASKAIPGQDAAVAHFLSLVSEEQIRGVQSPAESRMEDAAQQLNRSESFSLSTRVVSGVSGESGLVTAVSGQRSESRSQKSEVRDQSVRLNHAMKAEIRGQRSEVRNHIAGVGFVVPTPIGSFPINGTGAGQGFTLPDGKSITITFKATLNAPPSLSGPSNPKVTAQATLTGSFVGNPLLSDDPSVVGSADPTSTNVDLYDSTTTLSASPSNSTNTGQAVTFTATIGTSGTPNGSAFNRTGTVNFKDNGATMGCDSQTVSHVGSNDVATCTTSSLATGSHTNITAAYSGDGNFDPSTSSAFTQTVSKSGTNATLTSSLNPSTVTQNVTFTATITTATSVPNPTGTVTFKDNGGAITCSNAGGQTLNGSGVATCQISTLGAGNHPITADYSGDTNFNVNNGIVLSGGSPAGNQTVNKATPTVTLVSSTNPSFVSQNVTFTATVAAPGGISATPSGTLTFRDGGVAMTCTGGTQSLSGGVATCQKNNLTAGSHTITVDYPTDANFNAVSGTAMTAAAGQNGNPQVVNQSNTTMTVSSSLNPSKVTESVTFTLQIKSANLATVPGPPTGQVKFWDGPANTGTQIGATKTLNNAGCVPDANSACVVSDATTSLNAGTHTITVEYLGDNDKFTANAQTLSGGQVVNKSDTTTTITSDLPDPSNVAQTVNIVAHVVSTGVAFTNTGTVLFKEGSNTIAGCNAVSIVAGDATCSTTALPAGTLSLTAVYSGDATFNTSTSAAEPHQVGPTCSNSIVVTDNADSGANTLRGAIASICDGGTITFAPALPTITLATELHFTTKNMTITGPGSGLLTVSGGNATRVFDVDSGRTITISGLTISGGKFLGGAGAPGFGGGVLNSGNLTLSNVTLSGNQAIGGVGGAGAVGGDGEGGAIFNSGTLALKNSIASGNTATGGNGGDSNSANGNGGNAFGGGIYNTGTLTLTNTTVSTNNSNGGAAGSGSGTAGVVGNGLGGGIYNNATASPDSVTISNSTISGNGASLNGGGIANVGLLNNATLAITNSTISGNMVNNDGGGLYNDSVSGTTTITASTVTDNHADNDSSLVGTGGGIRVVSGPVILQDTIVANNFVASLQVETATVTGGPITAGVAQVETLTVVMTSPPITTAGNGKLRVTISGSTLPDKTISLVNGDNEASVAIKIRDLLNADAAVHGPYTATVGTGGNTADVILTRNTPAANDPSLNLEVVGCGASPCTGLNSAPTSSNTTAGVAGSAGTKQVETMTVLNGPVSGCPGGTTGTVTVLVIANGMTGSGTPFTVSVNETDSAATVGDTVRNFINGVGAPNVKAFFDVTGSGATLIFTAKQAAADDSTMAMSVTNGTCSGINSVSAHTTAGVAPFAGSKQIETLTVGTPAITVDGDAKIQVTVNGVGPTDYSVAVTAGQDAVAVALAIKNKLNTITDITNSYVVTQGANPDDDKVILTALTEAQGNDPSLLISIVGCDTCTGTIPAANSVNTQLGNPPVAGTPQVETLTVLSGPSGCPGATGTISVIVIANGMTGTGNPFPVTVNQTDTAAQVADTIKTFLANGGPPDLTGFFTITGSGANVVFTRTAPAANDPTMNVSVLNGTCTVVTASSNTQAGVAPITAVNQVETATVSITSSPISTNGTGVVRVTFNSTTLPDYNVPLLAGDDEAAVAVKIRDILNADAAFNGTYTASVGTGGNTNKVILTKNSPAANDASLNLEIVGCGSTCPGLNSVATSANTTTGVAPGTGTAKVTITANPAYFYPNPGLPGPGTKDIFVPVLASDTAAQVAAKIRDFLNNNDTDVSPIFMASAENEKVRLTRRVIAPDDPTLTISIDNGTSTGLTPSPTSENTRLGGGSVIHDDINGAIDGTSTFNLVGVSTGMTGITNGSGNNQVGTGGSPIDPKLDPLADNSGPTRTHKLQDNSPAIDKGNKFSLTTDQRGFQRPVDLDDGTYPNVSDASDIGAFERQTPPAQPTITLTSANTAGTTRDSTPDFSIGSLTVGATVELLRGGNPTSPPTTIVATAATMALTDNTLTTDGLYSYSARQTIGGDTATSTTTAVTVDTRPTVTALLAADDTGASSSDKITKNTTPRFTGTADINTSLQLFASNGGPPVQVGTGTSDGSGNWTITSSVLAQGTYSITAKEVIGGFTGAASSPLTGVVIDTSVAPPSTPVLLPADDSGAADNITNKTTPTFTGTAEANSAIQLFANGNPVGTGSADGSGNWSVTSSALSDGTYLMTAVATDLAGNVSAASSSLSVTIDTQIAAPSTPDLITADDSGTFNNDNYTNVNKPHFSGTAESGSTVKVFANSVEVGSGTATGGSWSIMACVQPACTALADGTYSITATATDTAGNTSVASSGLSVTIDTQAPAKPTVPPDLIAADDTGASSTDNITKTTKPTFNGASTTVEAGSIVDLFADNGLGGGPVGVGTGSADGSGAWSVLACTLPGCTALADGTYQFTVKAVDLAGNQSVASDPLQVVIDTVPPSVPSTPVLNPADDTGISPSDKITKVNIPNFTGEAEADSTVQLFANGTPVGSGLATGAPGSPGNKAWSITSGLLPDNSYSITAQATDVAGNTSSGFSGAFGPLVIDTVKPTVSMASAAGNPTATALIPVTVQFSEPVFGFTISDIVPSNGTVSNFAGSNANYSFDLTATAAGGVSADIAADTATDTAGNGNTAAVQFNRTYDPSALNATITAISPNPRNTAVSSIQIVFNKPVTGFDLSDLTLKLNNGANLLTGAQTLNSADNATWTLGNLAGLTTAEGTYDLKLTAAGSNIKDSTNTALASDATASWVMDTTPPTVTVEQVGPDPVTGPTGTTTINFTATFSESVTGLTPSGVTIFGTANPTIVNVTGSGTTYNLAVQGMSHSGTVRASVNLNAATDSAGNGNAASTSVDNTVQFNADNLSTLEVNSLADTDDGQCAPVGTGNGCTLREAINAANADFGAETITFAPALTSGGPAIIKLATALPDLSTDMTIQGPGANVLTVMRSDVGVIPRFRVFTITAGTVGLSGLTITNGATASGTNGVTGGPGIDGGGISNGGTLTLSAVTITGNSAGSGGSSSGANPGGSGGQGGGVFNNGTLAINNSTINGNNAGAGGDGVAVGGTGGSGGGIYHTGAGTLTITNSTISGNQTGVGGNPSHPGGSGGGIATAGTLTLTSSTVTANSALGSGGGLSRTAGVTTLQNSIIGGNTAGVAAPDISGTVQSDGFNLIQNTSGATINQNGGAGPDITGQDPLLNPLADNGGPTFTHSLQCSSPAIDKGKAFGAPPDSLRDQRGGSRPFDFSDAVYPNAVGGDGSDIGAVETQSAGGCVPTAVPPAVQPTTTSEDTPVQITLTGTYSQNINLTFSITQSPAIGALGPISAPNCNFNLSMTCTATVTYTPAANVNGADLFKFKVSASGLDSDPADVNISVSAVNDPPTFGITSNHTVNEDAGPQTVNNFAFNISPGAANESSQVLQFIVTNNTNPGLFSASPAIDSTGTLSYTSAANANGSATITVVLKDDGGTANGGNDTSTPKTFTITVNSVNDAPSFALAGNQTVLEDAGPQTVANFATAISVGPPQESGQTAQFIITNNTNAGMFSAAPAISPTGTLTYTPAPDANGSATITLVLKDNGGTANGGVDTSAPQTFTINVTAVNDAPTLDLLADRTINEDAPTQTVSLAGITAGGGEVQVLAVTATSNNPALIPNPTVNYTSPSTTGSISFTPVADQNGTAIITVTVNDGGGTANGGVQTVTRTFTVTVNAVNDAPINNLPGPQTIAENSPLTFSTANANLISITDVDAGASPVRVTLTATNGVITLSTTAGLAFSVGDGTADPTMTFTGTLASINTALQGMTFTPTNGFSGAAALQIITNDQGNTGIGGALSDTDTLSITVNDGGTLQLSAATYTVSENAGPAVITITRTGGSAGTATVQIATSNGTATAGSDYTAVNQTVTFNNGETSKTVNIPITDDLLNEPDETVNLTLSNVGGSGALGTPAIAVLTISDNDPAGGYIKFSSPTYSVAEGGVATITVQRQGTLSQAVTVNFATSDDSDPASMVLCAPTPGNTLASSRCDFTSAFGRITFAAGDGADKTFKVLTTQDSYVEGPETFTVTLSSPTNSATLALPSTATVTITDDAIEPPTNPVDDSNAFVEQLYRDFLNRPADPAGKAFWVNNIDHCNDPAQRPAGQTAAQCIQLSRIVTAAAFFLSIEFQATGGTAYLTNKAAFGSRPNFARFEQDAQQIGLNYVFGQPGAEALLEANKVAYYNDYVTRPDFVNTYGGVPDSTYVNTLIANTGVTFTQVERDGFVNGLANQSETRATVLRKISEKGTFRAAEFNSMFVLMEYYGFLRRNPDTAGFNFWLNKLNTFNGNYLDAEMVKAFIESSEYRQRFGP